MTTDPLYRPPTRTEASPAQLLSHIHALVTQRIQHANVARLLTAQAMHEGARWNYNVGGHKRAKGQPWTSLGTHEVLPVVTGAALIKEGKAGPPKFAHKAPPGYAAVYLFPGPNASPATHFRAFDSLAEGVAYFVDKALGRFGSEEALKALDAADPQAYAAALKKQYYFTADVGEYGAALARHLAKVAEVEAQSFGDGLLSRVAQ